MASTDEYAKVVAGVVTQVIVADGSFIAALPDSADWVLTPIKVGAGFTYADSIFTAPEV